MAQINLHTYQVAEPKSASLVALGLFGACLRLWDILAKGTSFSAVLGIGALVVASWQVSRKVTKSSVLDPEEKSLSLETSVFGIALFKRTVDLSSCSWVRGRLTGNHQTQITIEVGTNGYQTIELFKLPYHYSAGVSKANEVCGQVAGALSIEDHGYKGLA